MQLWKVVGLVVSTFVAYKITMIAYHFNIIQNPGKYMNANYPKTCQRAEVMDTCEDVPFENVKTIENVHTFGQMYTILKDFDTRPVLFKNFLKNPREQWDGIYDKYANENISFTEMDVQCFGSLLIAGSIPRDPVYKPMKYLFDETHGQTLFASFVKFVDPHSIDKTKSSDNDEFSSRITADTNFLANFPKDIVSTSLHAAPLAKSYALQYLGRKLWIFVSPDDMERFDLVTSIATLVVSGNEKEFFKYKKDTTGVIVAVQEEGDLLYFPPHWGHTVITSKGYNVMLNFREQGLFMALRTQAWRVIEALSLRVASKLATELLSKWDIHYTYKASSITSRIFEMRHENLYGEIKDFNSPCMDRWIAMLNK